MAFAFQKCRIKVLFPLLLAFLAWSQIQYGFSNLLFLRHLDKILIAVIYLVIGPFAVIRAIRHLSVSSVLFLAAWFLFGAMGGLLNHNLGPWTWLALSYVFKSFLFALAVLALKKGEQELVTAPAIVSIVILQTASSLFGVAQATYHYITTGFHNGSINLDYVTGLAGDANLAGLGALLGLVALHSLKPLVDYEKYPQLMRLADFFLKNKIWNGLHALFIVTAVITSSKFTVYALLFLLIPLFYSSDMKAKALIRIRQGAIWVVFGTAVFLVHKTYYQYLIHLMGDRPNETLGAAFARDFYWDFAAQSCSTSRCLREGGGQRLLKLVTSFQFWRKSQPHWFCGTGAGSTLFSGLQGHFTPPLLHNLSDFANQSHNIKHSGYFGMDLATWLIEWGPLATLCLIATVLKTAFGYFRQRHIFAFFLLVIGILQLPVHDYFMGPMLGTLIFWLMASYSPSNSATSSHHE